MRVLIIEDEEKTADYLHRGLTEQGYTVDVARDGVEGALAQADLGGHGCEGHPPVAGRLGQIRRWAGGVPFGEHRRHPR